ncbi:MAG TPA: zinc ribbon domain-containing protein [Chthoniobacterales bacterium]|nr:zinc ribbon domain-containing protein [Chthoniobacterales bacterium]
MITQQQATAIRLVCPECRHENESERIYCHECGARLDRSALTKAKLKEEDPTETHRRVKTMFNPAGAKLRQRFFLTSKVVLVAVAAAAVVQMLRPPDMGQVPGKSDALFAPPINMDLETATADPRVGPLRYSEEQVNAFLAYALKSKQSTLSKYGLKFERAVVALGEGTCRVTLARSLYGFPLYTTAIYNVALRDGKLSLTNQGGQVGRLPVHPMAMKYGDVLFADFGAALERERKNVVKLAGLEVHPKLVVFLPRS